jgi:hypothetical protein
VPASTSYIYDSLRDYGVEGRKNMTVFSLLGAGACLQGKSDHALAVGKFWGRDLALLTEVGDGGSSASLFCGSRKIERKKSQNTFKGK